MTGIVSVALMLTALTNVRLLGSSRLHGLISTVAIQGVVLGLLPLFLHWTELTAHLWLIAAAAVSLKAIVFPHLLHRAMREAEVQREVEPFVGYGLSLLIGLLLLGLSAWVGRRMPLPHPNASPLIVPVALFTLFCGLFLIITRRKALTQVLGYLVMENGVYAFAAAIAHDRPMLVESGILLDLFVAVFVMGIMVFNIQREFDHIDVDRLDELRDTISRVPDDARGAEP